MDYDIIVIGAGPGGYVAAIKAAQLGKKVCIIEKDHVGGTCLNVGCIPTKALLKSTEIMKHVREAGQYGVEIPDGDIALNLEKVQIRKKQIVGGLVNGVKGLLKKNGVSLVTGSGRLLDSHTVQVGERRFTAETIILATGSAVKELPLENDGSIPVYTSTEILELTEVPAKTTVIGGGVIGVELAYFLSSAGSEVTILEFQDRILPPVDQEITAGVEQQFKDMGIVIHTSANVVKIENNAVCYEKNGVRKTTECEAVLMAVGRKPFVDNLGLEAVGIRSERGAVVTDSFMRTNIDNIYAIGDINGKSMLAHTASMEALIAVENICGHERKMDYSKIPSAIYICPEIASIGLTEDQARKKYGAVKVGKFPMLANGKSQIEGESSGMIKVIADEKYLEILGVHMQCTHATDMIAEMCVAMNLECTADELIRVIHPHPTISESIAEACHAIESKAIHF